MGDENVVGGFVEKGRATDFGLGLGGRGETKGEVNQGAKIKGKKKKMETGLEISRAMWQA